MEKTYTGAQIIRELLRFGRAMTLCGADIRLIETTLEDLGRYFGAKEMHVFVISAVIIITAANEEGQTQTQSIRITKKIGYDFTKLEKLYDLANKAKSNQMSLDEFIEARRTIDAQDQLGIIAYLGSIFAAGGFAIFFGGTLLDGCIAALVGSLFCLLQRKVRRYCPNDIVFNFIACFITGIVIHIFKFFIPNLMEDMVTIGVIMLPIPGIPITNAVRDMFAGDIITGILRFVESLLITAGIAAGFISALTVVGA